MIDAVRQQYLEAMGITAWVRRGQRPPGSDATPAEAVTTAVGAAVDSSVRVGPGEGPGLCVCAGADEASDPLASDIARAMGAPPAWAWPDTGPDAGTLEDVAGERLFTGLVVFGAGLARMLFDGDPPVSCGPARVVVVPSLGEMETSGDARRACWRALREAGLVASG